MLRLCADREQALERLQRGEEPEWRYNLQLDDCSADPEWSEAFVQAREKQLYSELHCASLRSFVQDETRSFGLILCLDALVYLRNLDDIFCGSRSILNTEGYFIFSTEASEHMEPFLQSSGRYAHSRAYIRSILKADQWKIVECQKTQLRKDGDHWIDGDIWVLQGI